MDNIIQALIEIDEEAHKKIESVENRLKTFDEEVKEASERITGDIQKRTLERLNELSEEAANEITAGTKELEREAKEALAKITETYELNHETWETEIFNKIIGSNQH